MKVIKELDRINVSAKVQAEEKLNTIDPVLQAQKLIIQESEDIKNFLDQRGFLNGLNEMEDESKELQSDLSEIGKIFTDEQIINVQKKFGLTTARIEHYRGTLPLDIYERLKKYEDDEYPLEGSSSMNEKQRRFKNRSREYFIMAPHELFSPEAFQKPKLDPFLFEKLSWGKFRLVTSWGNDLTVWRYLRYNFFSTRERALGSCALFSFLISSIFTLLWLMPYFSMTFNEISLLRGWENPLTTLVFLSGMMWAGGIIIIFLLGWMIIPDRDTFSKRFETIGS